jgi:hypothetical protein
MQRLALTVATAFLASEVGCTSRGLATGGDGSVIAADGATVAASDVSPTGASDGASSTTASDGSSGLVASISKDGVTWTFAAPMLAGQFVTGDYWIVGPATVTAISPAPTSSTPFLNGSVLNLPTTNGKSPFDSRLNDGSDESWWFDASFRAYPPVSLKAGDSLVSSISLVTPASLPEVMRASDKSCSPVGSASVLTVLAAAPSADAFRPSYCDRSQTLYRAGALQRQLLPAHPAPKPQSTPTLAQFEALFRRPWIDTNAFLFDAPAEYMPSYGQHVAFAVSYASLLLLLDFPAADKEPLTNYLAQYGIDLYGCVKAGYGWPAFGGHRSGRKLPILIAGLLLQDQGMKNVSATYANRFGEDMQTVYINQIPGGYSKAWQGATVIYGGHYGVDQTSGTPTDTSSNGLYAPYEQLQPKDWQLLTPTEQLGEAYRRCCTSVSWVGEALAARMLGAQSTWNHPAFFDYVDRWMTEDDTQAVADIKTQSGLITARIGSVRARPRPGCKASFRNTASSTTCGGPTGTDPASARAAGRNHRSCNARAPTVLNRACRTSRQG